MSRSRISQKASVSSTNVSISENDSRSTKHTRTQNASSRSQLYVSKSDGDLTHKSNMSTVSKTSKSIRSVSIHKGRSQRFIHTEPDHKTLDHLSDTEQDDIEDGDATENRNDIETQNDLENQNDLETQNDLENQNDLDNDASDTEVDHADGELEDKESHPQSIHDTRAAIQNENDDLSTKDEIVNKRSQGQPKFRQASRIVEKSRTIDEYHDDMVRSFFLSYLKIL